MSKKKENKKGFYAIQILVAEIGNEKWRKLSANEQEEKIKEKKDLLDREAPSKKKELKYLNKKFRGRINMKELEV